MKLKKKNYRVPAGQDADWTREFRNIQMFSVVNLSNWFVIVPNRNRREAGDFVKQIIQVGKGMNMQIREPQ